MIKPVDVGGYCRRNTTITATTLQKKSDDISRIKFEIQNRQKVFIKMSLARQQFNNDIIHIGESTGRYNQQGEVNKTDR